MEFNSGFKGLNMLYIYVIASVTRPAHNFFSVPYVIVFFGLSESTYFSTLFHKRQD